MKADTPLDKGPNKVVYREGRVYDVSVSIGNAWVREGRAEIASYDARAVLPDANGVLDSPRASDAGLFDSPSRSPPKPVKPAENGRKKSEAEDLDESEADA